MHPANLALRFFLEIAALGGFSVLGWTLTEGWWRYLAVIVVLAVLMSLWGVFAVPDDPSRSGNAPVPVSGGLRLMLEFAILFGGAGALHAAEYNWAGPSLAALVILHYLLWADRIAWLLQN
ncbi:YrdB family protein [Aliiroseovarius subalbicans]|uniref:YrdB family protein n=1 Tax=Aliiroseovarius subalbicans TaxID=2925840 RepID=UPI001F59EAB1|nr:YrdB family protein [Aliiroseovarius subalbicans]MCI2398973.1 YrdB family protein [Aliiroseovarius subalbicans]